VLALTLVALNVLLAAEAEAGMEARAMTAIRTPHLRRQGIRPRITTNHSARAGGWSD